MITEAHTMTAPAKVTKKQLQAEGVARRKFEAYRGKVRRLIDHFRKGEVPSEEIEAAYKAGIEAETFAAVMAEREPVGRAVHPLKADAIQRAHDWAVQDIAAIRKRLENAGWDINKVAPYPDYRDHSLVAQAAERYYTQVSSLTRWRNDSQPGGDRTIRLVDMDEESCENYIVRVERSTAQQFDLFIIKLVGKVGPVLDAKLEGLGVWTESILTVTKEGGKIERWKTQEITNVSKLGLYFPQWPTRLMKD